MNIGISTLTADPLGSFVLDVNESSSDIENYNRRVVRVATLDGGASIIDSGYTNADRTVSISFRDITKTAFDNVADVCQIHSSVLLFLPDGAYKASLEQVSYNNGSPTAKFLITGVGEVKLT